MSFYDQKRLGEEPAVAQRAANLCKIQPGEAVELFYFTEGSAVVLTNRHLYQTTSITPDGKANMLRFSLSSLMTVLNHGDRIFAAQMSHLIGMPSVDDGPDTDTNALVVVIRAGDRFIFKIDDQAAYLAFYDHLQYVIIVRNVRKGVFAFAKKHPKRRDALSGAPTDSTSASA
ncbi:Hypothetical protein POVN_LOCUS224 [uncultured virus]|nr:Hypothetical protein POVN_LOCUS224 [uncultured virus]